MDQDFSDLQLKTELGPEVGAAVGRIRSSEPDAVHVQKTIAAMETLVEDANRNTVIQNRHASNGFDWAARFSWATLAALVCIGLYLFFSVSEQVSFAQIARSITAQDWVHATESFENGKLESWFSPSLNISAISNDERVEFRNHNLGESYEFFRESQTIFRVSESGNPRPYARWSKLATCLPMLLADGLPNDPLNDVLGLNELRDQVEFLGHSIELTSDDNEQEYSIQCLMDEAPLEIVFYVDVKTQLPTRSVITGTYKGKTMTNTVEIAYPKQGPESIYDLGVPKNATLVNRLESEMGKFLRDSVYAGAKTFDDYRAVMVQHRVGRERWWSNARVEVVCRKGDCFTRRFVNPFGRTKKAPRKGTDLHAWWETQVSLAEGGPDGIPYNIVIGKDIWDFDKNEKTFEKRLHGDNGFHCWSLRPDMIARPPMGGSAAHLKIRVDENPESGPPGTILYELVQTNDKSVTRSWIDPNQGYLVEQSESGPLELWDYKTIVEKAAKSPSGIWYPVRLRSYWRHQGEIYEDETNCYVDFESEIPDRLFKLK